MGEVIVDIDLENCIDRLACIDGRLAKASLRKWSTKAVVDTGAVMLTLPQDVVEKLGLNELRRAIVRYPDERCEERPIAGPVWLQVGERSMIAECVVMPPASEPLLGQIPLEAMDLVVDCQRNILGPRPESPIYPMLNLR
ncbi:MAG: hypothetical protein NTX50_16275 [Candidatus Sumerlaeota bacterium]|nr:hypothetical protein [Candidatus Sumerlaeota bacterium]